MNTIIETIRAEIERLKGQLIRGACAAQIQMETSCKDEAYDEMLSFLDTLEEEPVEVELEEYASQIVAKLVPSLGQKYPDGRYVGGIRDYFSREELIGLVKAGAKWKKEQSELSCEGLEEEMIAWHKKHFNGKRKWEETSGEYLEHSSQLDLARHFAKWGAEHCGGSEKPNDLPTNLEEASEAYSALEYDCHSETDAFYAMLQRDAFKAGAMWDREQGVSFNTEVGWIDGKTIMDWPDDILDGFEMGDKVIVQIRKKDE